MVTRGEIRLSERTRYSSFFAHGVWGLAVHDLKVAWDEGLPQFFTHAVLVEDSKDIELRNVQGRAARVGLEAVHLERCEDVRSDARP